MLLPSALSCESSHTTTTPKRQLFASPPLSPPSSSSSSSHPAIANIYSTCRALQSMLSPPPQQPSQLPSPPTVHAESPCRLRLRARSARPEDTMTTRRRITKRAAAPPRGVNKRRRAIDDDMSRDTVDAESENEDEEATAAGPSTPKRARLAPEVLPLGLERSDFHDLRLQEVLQSQDPIPSIEEGNKNEEWSTEDDRILVELVLEKLKLSKSDWQDCARSLGKDRSSVGKRWKSLMVAGEVGLKSSRSRRAKIHGTWR